MGGSEAIALAMAIADGTYLAQGTAPRPKNTCSSLILFVLPDVHLLFD